MKCNPASPRPTEPVLAELQSTIENEIPMGAHMGIHVQSYDASGLTMGAPLAKNRNHQGTCFAGSLNALCTLAGWGSIYLLLRQHGLSGSIVIRRSAIKYLKPVVAPQILAHCGPVGDEERAHFLEMFADKGQAKLDLRVEIAGADGPAVTFHGSYVVVRRG